MKCGSAGTASRVEGTAEGQAWVGTRSPHFRTTRRPERPGRGDGVSGGTWAGLGRHGTGGLPRDGSPLEAGVVPVGTRGAFAWDVPLPSGLSLPGSALSLTHSDFWAVRSVWPFLRIRPCRLRMDLGGAPVCSARERAVLDLHPCVFAALDQDV